MTPLDFVLERVRLPAHIERVHPLQAQAINDLAPLQGMGGWLDMGTGKTLVATVIGLFLNMTQGRQTIVIMPPVLIGQWMRWLLSLTPAPSVTDYRGTPTQRAKKNLDAQFILVGLQIFRKDHERFVRHFQGRPKLLVVDEATMIAWIGSTAHERVFDFSIGDPALLLTGTPMNKVTDAYGLIKFTAPGTYRNYKQFDSLHIEDKDFFDRPKSFCNLDILKDNLAKNSFRILYSDMYSDIEEPLMVPIEYDLEPAHYRLYTELAENELLKLPDGGKIEATTANKLRHALGQIIVNWGHFAGDPAKESAPIELVKEKLEELGGKKLVIFADYKLTVRCLVEKLAEHGAVAINSEVSDTQKERNIQRFINDPTCRVIVIQFISGGKGLDGLQHVCHHCLFIEPCQQPRDFWQAVARLKRTGQKNRVMVMLPIANKTVQRRGFKNLLENDTLVNQVVRNKSELRALIYGD
jgi:SNF2 family DNA or RNA helicase